MVLLDEDSQIIGEGVIGKGNEAMVFCDKVADCPEVSNQPLLNLMDDGMDVLIPYNDGEDFIIQSPSNHTLSFLDFYDVDLIKGRLYGEIFPLLKNINLVKALQETYKTGKTHKVTMLFYDNERLVTSFHKVLVYFNNKVYIIVKRDSRSDLIFRQEHDLFYNNPNAMIVYQNESIIKVNQAFADMLGYNIDDVLGKHYLFTEPKLINETFEEFIEINKKLLNRELFVYNGLIKLKHSSGKYIYVQYSGQPVVFNDQPAIQSSCIDVTDKIETEYKALQLQKDIDKIQKMAGIGIVHWDDVNGFRTTENFYNILEIKNNDNDPFTSIINLVFDMEKREDLREKLLNTKANADSFEITVPIDSNHGKKFIDLFVNFFIADNGVFSAVAYIQDVTERVIKEKDLKEAITNLKLVSNELRKNIDEKEVLLKEVHHRVKNNLQIILSLLNLDMRYNPDDYGKIIESIKNRVNSMALIHEKIYQSSDLAHVNAHNYIESEIMSLFNFYNVKNIKLIMDIDNLELEMDTIIPLGLIINECITNTIKYAFPNNEEGNLVIKLKSEGDLITFLVSDDGIGLPEDFSVETSDSLGLTIIKGLTEQIDGSIQLSSVGGTSYKIQFNEKFVHKIK